MNVSDLGRINGLKPLNVADSGKIIKSVYCCDLLSVAMGKAPEKCAWVTVMSNINTLAVATLTDTSCVIIAADTVIDDRTLTTAKEKNINVFSSSMPVFETALEIHKELNCG